MPNRRVWLFPFNYEHPSVLTERCCYFTYTHAATSLAGHRTAEHLEFFFFFFLFCLVTAWNYCLVILLLLPQLFTGSDLIKDHDRCVHLNWPPDVSPTVPDRQTDRQNENTNEQANEALRAHKAELSGCVLLTGSKIKPQLSSTLRRHSTTWLNGRWSAILTLYFFIFF